MVTNENVCLRSDLKRTFKCGGPVRWARGALSVWTLLGAAAVEAPQENQGKLNRVEMIGAGRTKPGVSVWSLGLGSGLWVMF